MNLLATGGTGYVGSHMAEGRAVEESAPPVRAPLRLLLIGPLPPPTGGALILFQYLVDDLRLSGECSLRVVNISRPSGRNWLLFNAWVALRAALQTFVLGMDSDVISLHANERGRTQFGPIVYLISRILDKPLVVRAFGGAFDRQMETLGALHRWILKKTYFRSEACLFETKHLMESFRSYGLRRSEWFPNYTRLPEGRPPTAPPASRSCRKLVFLARMERVKGVELLFEAEENLAPGVTVDLFGPPEGGYSVESLRGRGGGRVRYRGLLNDREVCERLWEYDALVLPTFHPGEGYPGAILEAYAHGLPVITTRWLSLPEIVDETCGILVEPGSMDDFVNAVNRLASDDSLYASLQAGSAAKAPGFSDRVRTRQFLDICRDVAGRHRAGAED